MPPVAIALQQLPRIVICPAGNLQYQLLQASAQREIHRIHTSSSNRLSHFERSHPTNPSLGKIRQWFGENLLVQHVVQVVERLHIAVVNLQNQPLRNVLQMLAQIGRCHGQQRFRAILDDHLGKMLQRCFKVFAGVREPSVESRQKSITPFRCHLHLVQRGSLFPQTFRYGRTSHEQLTKVNVFEISRFLHDGQQIQRFRWILRRSLPNTVDAGQQPGPKLIPSRHDLVHQDLINSKLPKKCRHGLVKAVRLQHRSHVYQLDPGHEAVVHEQQATLVVQSNLQRGLQNPCRTAELADLHRQRRNQRDELQPVWTPKGDVGGAVCPLRWRPNIRFQRFIRFRHGKLRFSSLT
uniref:(northern house mosquito) hypothetical protein n=1 Tax=Culex pipiens TaxID=7175 RepID=A0A8D8B223_CULPI